MTNIVKQIIVEITNGKQTYSEDVYEEEKEYWNEISTNGANKELEGKTFEWWTRPLKKFKMIDSEKYNTKNDNAHFIFGFLECFGQSDDVPEWMMENSNELWVEVYHSTYS